MAWWRKIRTENSDVTPFDRGPIQQLPFAVWVVEEHVKHNFKSPQNVTIYRLFISTLVLPHLLAVSLYLSLHRQNFLSSCFPQTNAVIPNHSPPS